MGKCAERLQIKFSFYVGVTCARNLQSPWQRGTHFLTVSCIRCLYCQLQQQVNCSQNTVRICRLSASCAYVHINSKLYLQQNERCKDGLARHGDSNFWLFVAGYWLSHCCQSFVNSPIKRHSKAHTSLVLNQVQTQTGWLTHPFVLLISRVLMYPSACSLIHRVCDCRDATEIVLPL